MSRVTQDTTPNLPTPELRAFADRTLQELKLAFSKALAHEADRQSIPMPAAADATENRALAAIRTLPRSLKKRIVAGYTTRDAQARRDDLGAFADVPLDQDESLSAALHRGHPSGLGTLDLFGETTLAMWSVPDDSTKEHRKLRMVLEALECVEATTGAGDDDMALGAITNSAAGHTKKIGPEFVAALQSGQTHHFSGSAAELASWSFEADHKLNIEGATFDVGWPRSYFVTWLLAEEDWGGFGTFVNEMYQQVKAEVEAKIEDSASDLTTLLVAEGIGATVGAVLGNVIGAVVGAVAGLLIAWFVGLAEDDIFTPITVSVDIDSPYSPFGADDRTDTRQVWWKGHGGHYKLRYHWEVYDAVPVLEMLEANALAATRWNTSVETQTNAPPRAAARRPAATRLDLFARGDDRGVYQSTRRTSEWTPWRMDTGSGTFRSGPASCSWAPGRLEIFARGDDDRLWQNSWNGSRWSGYTKAFGEGLYLSGPAVISRRKNWVDVVAIGQDRRMWHLLWTGERWHGPQRDTPDGTFRSAPCLAGGGARPVESEWNTFTP